MGVCPRRPAVLWPGTAGGGLLLQPDRGGEHPAVHLADFRGFLQADGYSGFAALYEPRQAEPGAAATAAITEVACWSHCRRKIFDVWETTKSSVAKAATRWAMAIYLWRKRATVVLNAPRRIIVPILTKENGHSNHR